MVKTTLSEEKRKKLVEGVKSMLAGLKIVKVDDWGQKVFAYPIKRERSGFYVRMMIEGEKMPEGFEKKLLTNEDILRQLIIRRN